MGIYSNSFSSSTKENFYDVNQPTPPLSPLPLSLKNETSQPYFPNPLSYLQKVIPQKKKKIHRFQIQEDIALLEGIRKWGRDWKKVAKTKGLNHRNIESCRRRFSSIWKAQISIESLENAEGQITVTKKKKKRLLKIIPTTELKNKDDFSSNPKSPRIKKGKDCSQAIQDLTDLPLSILKLKPNLEYTLDPFLLYSSTLPSCPLSFEEDLQDMMGIQNFD